jgi:hypothetical protein
VAIKETNMPKKTLERRVSELEAKVAEFTPTSKPDMSFVDSVWGVFRGDPVFLEAMKLGRQYRESLRPKRKSTAARKRKNARARH